jgi:hypothetical protein
VDASSRKPLDSAQLIPGALTQPIKPDRKKRRPKQDAEFWKFSAIGTDMSSN